MVQIIGHRGARGIEPENTMRSFRKALELKVDLIECDVHMTKDDHIVLIHDHTVDRTTNATGPVNGFTFEEIRRLDAGKGEIIPTLQELLHRPWVQRDAHGRPAWRTSRLGARRVGHVRVAFELHEFHIRGADSLVRLRFEHGIHRTQLPRDQILRSCHE